jgi:hypothetical protein
MKLEDFLPCSKQPTIYSFNMLNEFSLYPPTYMYKVVFNIILQSASVFSLIIDKRWR